MTTSLNNLRPFASKDMEIQRLRQEVKELHATIVKIHEEYRPEVLNAERWRETMLEWGDGVVNGFGDFWDRISAQMTHEEQQAAIDAAREGE